MTRKASSRGRDFPTQLNKDDEWMRYEEASPQRRSSVASAPARRAAVASVILAALSFHRDVTQPHRTAPLASRYFQKILTLTVRD